MNFTLCTIYTMYFHTQITLTLFGGAQPGVTTEMKQLQAFQED